MCAMSARLRNSLRAMDRGVRKLLLPVVVLIAVGGGIWKWQVQHRPEEGLAGILVVAVIVIALEIGYRRTTDFGPKSHRDE